MMDHTSRMSWKKPASGDVSPEKLRESFIQHDHHSDARLETGQHRD